MDIHWSGLETKRYGESSYPVDTANITTLRNMHHTKEKGDRGVLEVQLDLFKQGWMILHPQTEHAPFDLVAYRNGKFRRVQVKYRKCCRGKLTVTFRRSWSDKNGVHCEYVNMNNIDVFGIYCPTTNECYYIDTKPDLKCVTINLDDPSYKSMQL